MSDTIQRILDDTWEICSPFVKDKIPSVDAEVNELSFRDKLIEKPDVSVVVVTYAHEKCISECIESICQQKTDYSIEVLVADDNSPDKTRDVCLGLQEKWPDKIRIFYSAENVGLAANNARLTKKIRGRYVAICEGDDYWCDMRKIQKQISFLEANPDVAVVHAGCYNQYEYVHWARYPNTRKNSKRLLRINDEPSRCQREELLRKNYISTPTVCIRRDDYVRVNNEIDKLGERVRWLTVTDFVTWFLCSKYGKICFMPDYMAVRRINSKSITANKNIEIASVRRLGDFRIALALADAENMSSWLLEEIEGKIEKTLDDINNIRAGKTIAFGGQGFWAKKSALVFLLRRVILFLTRI